MKEELLVEVIQKRKKQNLSNLLTQFEQNFRCCYTITSDMNLSAKSPYLKIKFHDLSEITRRTTAMIEMCDYFLKAFPNHTNIDRFHYFQRVLNHRSNSENDKDAYLIIRYKTLLIPQFKQYFQILNSFFSILGILCFIEETKDGFRLFFEREIDFLDFLENITSKQSLIQILRDKHILLPPHYFEEVINVVQKKLTISEN